MWITLNKRNNCQIWGLQWVDVGSIVISSGNDSKLSKKQKPLNLNQFNQQTMKFDKNLILYLDKPEKLRIFGYRLENNQIIFG